MKHFFFFILLLIPFTASSNSNWKNLNSKTSANLYSVRFVNASVGFASGAGGIVVKTIDGGATWTVLNNIALVAQAPPDLYALFPTSSTTVYTTGTNATIVQTQDAGTSWSYQSGVYKDQRSIFFVDADTGYCVGYGEVVVKTTDKGAHWFNEIAGVTIKKSGGGKNNIAIGIGGEVDWLHTVTFTTKIKGFTAGSRGNIYGTVDGGATWLTKFSILNKSLQALHFPSQKTGYVVGTGGFIAKTSDNGDSWETVPSGTVAALYDVHFLSDTVGYVVGAQGLILKTTNGGNTWKTEFTNTWGDLHSIYFPTPDVGYAVGKSGTAIKWSKTVSVGDEPTGGNSRMKITGQYPNPATSAISISLESSSDEMITLRVVDALGREQVVRNEELYAGATSLQVSTAGFAAGVYSYMISSREKILRGRFIVE